MSTTLHRDSIGEALLGLSLMVSANSAASDEAARVGGH